MAKALNQGLRAAMEADPKVIVMGEDVGKLGGVFRITDGLQKDFGEQRVLDTPLAESGIIGTAVGLAIRGFRPVCEIQFDGFIFPAFDQIVSQLAKMHYRSQGKVKMPVVVRVPFGGGIGAVEHHSESPESYFAHTAGLRVVSLLEPGGRLLDDPAGRRLRRPGAVLRAEGPLLREGRAGHLRVAAARCSRSKVLRTGTTATLASYGPSIRTLPGRGRRRPRRTASARGDRPAHAVPAGPRLRCSTSVRRTGRLVVVTESPGEASIASEVATRVQQECFYSLEAPVLRVTGFDTPYPPTKLEDDYLPDLDRVLHAVDRSLAW